MMSGPVCGLVLCNDPAIAKPMLDLTFPAFLQTRDQNKLAAAAWTAAEMLQFVRDYGRQIQANARALAVALEARGFNAVPRKGLHKYSSGDA